jgi:hypothetical protein
MSDTMPVQIQATGEATGFLPTRGNQGKPITVIGTAAIRDTFDAKCLEQAIKSRGAPGVTDLVINPDAHAGYGVPVGCVLVSPTHVDVTRKVSALSAKLEDKVNAFARVVGAAEHPAVNIGPHCNSPYACPLW